MEGALSYCARPAHPHPPPTRQQIVAKSGHAADCRSRSDTCVCTSIASLRSASRRPTVQHAVWSDGADTPAALDGVVSRPGLFGRLIQAWRVVHVSAPAGSGKTGVRTRL